MYIFLDFSRIDTSNYFQSGIALQLNEPNICKIKQKEAEICGSISAAPTIAKIVSDSW